MLYLLRIFLTMTISRIFLVLTAPSFFRRTQFSHLGISDSATPRTAAHQASLSITSSQSLLRFMSIELVMPSISSSFIPFSSCPKSFQASGSFAMSHFFPLSGKSIGASASASVLLMNIQDLFPLGWTGLISLQSKEPSRVFSNTTVQKHQFFGTSRTDLGTC